MQEWTYSDPRWWIDSIATACASDSSVTCDTLQTSEYFSGLKDRLAGTLRYLGAQTNIKPELVRRSLFFAKALKKWRLPVAEISVQDRAKRALAGFVERDLALADLGDRSVPAYYDGMRRVLQRWLPRIEGDLPIFGRFGPGACAERWPHPQRFCRLTEWLDAGLNAWQPTEYFSHADSASTQVSRLCAVPKDWDKDRLITIEPALQTYTQQYVRRVLLESVHNGPLRGTAMDLGYTDGQAIQRRLALDASRTGSRATIDLSDASDSISWLAVQAVFPEWVVDLLASARSDQFELPLRRGCAATLHIYAGMGNATTFPVETLFFSAFVYAWCNAHGLRPWVSTFGDDIIVASDVARGLLDEGYLPYFKINASKSFLGNDGIRESCGIFAFRGSDVTVPKVDGYLPGWEGRLGICDLHRRLVESRDAFQHLLASKIARCGLLDNWPFLVDGYPSIEDWSAEFSVLPRSRWNTHRCCREVAVTVEKQRTLSFTCDDAFVDASLDDCVLGLDARELQIAYFREAKPPARVWLDGVLSGACTTDPARIGPKGHSNRSRVSFPTGETRRVKAWRCCTKS